MTEFDPLTKLLSHPEAINAFLDGNWQAPPVGVEISPTNDCNARCPWCFYVSGEYKQRHSKEELPDELMSALLVDLSDMGVKSITWTGGGDPSVYSLIDEAIFEATALGLRQGIFTNAYKPLKCPEKLDWIRVTVTEKFTITKHVARYAAATKTGVNFNLCAENEQYLTRMVKQAREAGVAYFQVRPALADRADLQKPIECPTWLKDFETPTFRIVLTEYKWGDYLQPHGYPICHGHRIIPFIWHNGDVSVCAYHFGKPDYTLGNLNDGGFAAVWNGERRQKMLADGVKVIPDCQHNCKLHEVNKPLAALAGDVKDRVSDLEFP